MLMIDSIVVDLYTRGGLETNADITVVMADSMENKIITDDSPHVSTAAQAKTYTAVTVNYPVLLDKGIPRK